MAVCAVLASIYHRMLISG